MPDYNYGSLFPSGSFDFFQDAPPEEGEGPDLDMILEMLVPKRYQSTTNFRGGSHFGPSRHAYVPKENIESASQALKMIQGAKLSELELNKMQRAEEVIQKLREGTVDSAGNRVFQTMQELSPADQLDLYGAGYFGGGTSRSRSGGYSPYGAGGYGSGGTSRGYGSKPHEMAGARTDEMERAQETIGMINSMMLERGIESVDALPPYEKAAYERAWSVLGGGGGAPAEVGGIPAAGGEYVQPGGQPRTVEENTGQPVPTAAPETVGGGTMIMGGNTVQVGGGGGGMPAPQVQPPAPAASPSSMTEGEAFMQRETAAQRPFEESVASRDERASSLKDEVGWWVDLAGATIGKVDDWQERMALQRQGIDPDTNQLIMPDDPRFETLAPWAQAAVMRQLDQQRSQMANAGALGYPTYGYEGG